MRRKTAREQKIRNYFGLANGVEVFYSRKGMAGPNGEKLTGWFCNENGQTRHLGTSADTSVNGKLVSKTILPPPRLI